MPYNFNFDGLDIKTIYVSPTGWKPNSLIEYTVCYSNPIDSFESVCWRIAGTTHTFKIPLENINFISKGNYEEHFKKVLENFREEIISWKKTMPQTKWMFEYYDQFDKFILF